MGRFLGFGLMLGWGLVIAGLFRRLGPRRALLIAVVGGNLLIPSLVFDLLSDARLQFTQPVAIGLAVALGVMLSDPRGVSFSRIRVDWLDLPIVAYVVYSLSGLITSGPIAAWDAADMILQRGLGMLVPYAAARRYLGDAEGVKQLAAAIVVATLLFVPVVAFEAVMGPPWYLGRLYGAVPIEGMVVRLGGWRPEGFFLNGLALASWMALAAVVAFGLWVGRSWRPIWGPSWWPSLVLILASIGCRGVYGYISLGLGLTVAAITAALRTRWAIALLLLLAPLYIGLRLTGAWDAQALVRMAERIGREGTVDFRLQAEDGIITRLLEKHPVLGFGLELWHAPKIHETFGLWPDGQWMLDLWTGGLTGLMLHMTALALMPVGLALMLARPTVGRGPFDASASAAILALASFNALCLFNGLHNNAYFTPQALVAGSIAGIAVSRRQETAAPRPVYGSARSTVSAPGPNLSLVPIVTSTACLLYVFAHAQVDDHEGAKLVGGLGAGLLFAAAGAIGAWATNVAPLPRLAVFAVLFAVLGISFNVALHPANRPALAADILQGLAFSGLAVACWRRWVGVRVASDAVLVALPLVAHSLLVRAPIAFPGSQYLFTGDGGETSLFPLFPWLTMAALGAHAASVPAAAGGSLTALFAVAAALAWLSEPGPERLVKIPMDLAYALLSCAAIEAVFALAHGLKRLGAAARGAQWLGRNWLIYFYIHFALAFALGKLIRSPAPAVWILLAVGSIATTWLVARASKPLAHRFQSPAAWSALLILILLVIVTPGLPPFAVSALAGVVGLIFAVYHDALAYLVVNLRPTVIRPAWLSGFTWRSTEPSASGQAGTYRRTGASSPGQGRSPVEPAGAVAGGLGHGLGRLAVVFALIVLPEVIGLLTGTEPAPVSVPSFPAPSAGDGLPGAPLEPEGPPAVAPAERW